MTTKPPAEAYPRDENAERELLKAHLENQIQILYGKKSKYNEYDCACVSGYRSGFWDGIDTARAALDKGETK